MGRIFHSNIGTVFTSMDSDNLTNHLRPTTDAILTIRCIKSFEYRTCKNLVLHHVNLEVLTIGELKDLIRQSKCTELYNGVFTRVEKAEELTIPLKIAIKTTSGWKPYLNVNFGNASIS